jgi:hypothetical protein
MARPGLITLIASAAAVCVAATDLRAFAEVPYPDWSGGWTRVRDGKHGNWDPEKPRGLAQQAPLMVRRLDAGSRRQARQLGSGEAPRARTAGPADG